MATGHEELPAELHAIVESRKNSVVVQDMAGGEIKVPNTDVMEKGMDGASTNDGDEPSEHELKTLRRIGESMPISSYLIAVVELCERFTYYGAQGLFSNYIRQASDGSLGAPGLGLGKQAATGLGLFFQFFCYITPIFGAIIADQYWGKYKTIVFFAGIYFVGLLILWTTALPVALEHGAGVGGYIAAIIVIGFGTGGIKSNIAPLIADQYSRTAMAIRTEPSGERVVIDPAITYQRIYMVFYGCVNVGSLSLMATPFMEREYGFWSPFLLCFCMFCVALVILVLRRNAYVVKPPQGSVVTDAFKAFGMMITARNMDAAKPSWRAANGKSAVHWDDHFIDEVKRALVACKVFTFYPIFWLCYNQMSTNFVTQAAQMMGHGMPNDFMQNFDPITIIIFLPILDKLVYPLLRKWRVPLRPMARITIGFFLAAIGVAWGAICQKLVYSAGPCYESPLDESCATQDADGVYLGNNVHIAIQTPAYIFVGLAEIFLSVTGLEYAYTKAPKSMKSFVQSMYLFTNAIAAAIGEAFVPVSTDPKFLWNYAGISIATGIVGTIFWFTFKHLDDLEDEMNMMNREVDNKPDNRSLEHETGLGEEKGLGEK